MRFSKTLLITLFCLSIFSISGCKTKVAYTFFEWVADWYIGSYVTLTPEQAEQTKDIVSAFHDWHRETQLPIYADYLEGLKSRLSNNVVSGGLIHQETDTIQMYLDQSANRILPSVAHVMSSLNDGQVAQIMSALKKERDKYQKEYVDISQERVYKKRIKELKRNTKRLFGSLTKEQNQWVMAWAKQLQPYEALTLKQRELWADKLLDALHHREDQKQLQIALSQFVFYRTDFWDLELQKRLDYNQALTYDLVARIINQHTPKQREKMGRKLDQYVADFMDLSRVDQPQLSSR